MMTPGKGNIAVTHRDAADCGQDDQSSLVEILALGLRVVPARANGELLIPLRNATRDAQTIAAWRTKWPHADAAWVPPPSIVVATVANRYRNLAQFGGSDAYSVETPSIANERGGAHLLYSATAGAYRSPVVIEDAEIEISVGSHILLPTPPGSGRWWIRPFGETPLAPAPEWVDRAALEPASKPRPIDLFRWASSSTSSCDVLIAGASAVAKALGGKRRRGPGGNYQARCPAHDDRHPSLSIRNGDDGRLLLHCFAECTFFEIVAALEQRGVLPRRGS
jgi:hypothetical protein